MIDQGLHGLAGNSIERDPDRINQCVMIWRHDVEATAGPQQPAGRRQQRERIGDGLDQVDHGDVVEAFRSEPDCVDLTDNHVQPVPAARHLGGALVDLEAGYRHAEFVAGDAKEASGIAADVEQGRPPVSTAAGQHLEHGAMLAGEVIARDVAPRAEIRMIEVFGRAGADRRVPAPSAADRRAPDRNGGSAPWFQMRGARSDHAAPGSGP